ncbi:MAG: RNA polymerase sigma factor [Bacteroidota bacterium]
MNKQTQAKELEQLHEASYAWALRCCYEDQEAAEEVLQNTYLKILEGKAKFREHSSFKTWLFSVIRFTAIDHLRARKRRKNITLNQFYGDLSEEKIEENEQLSSNTFRTLLKQLSSKQQQVLHLVFYQNCTIEEAAKIMEIQLGTARTHYERGKKQLRKKLLKYEASR